jgi:hypothetical protein
MSNIGASTNDDNRAHAPDGSGDGPIATRRAAIGITAAAATAFLADRALLAPDTAKAAGEVESVNGQVGKVLLTAADVGAVPSADLQVIAGENLAVGEEALHVLAGETEAERLKHRGNTAIGWRALRNLKGTAITSTEDNTAVGSQAGNQLTTGGGNTLIGENAGLNLTTGEENVAIGCEALPRQQSVTGNIAIGFRAGWLNETGGGLVAIGYDAGEYQTSGEGNTYVGFTAGRYNVTSGANTAIGESALEGASGKSAGRNTAVGKEALNGCYANANTAIGYQAGASNKTGEGNIYIGCEAGNTATASNELIIANNPTTPLIAGTLSGTQKLGFYGVTPVARHATIAVPGGETTAELKAALKSVIEAIKAIGIIS